MIWLVALVLAAGPLDKTAPVSDTVDLIELNHFHDDQYRPVFDQILFYDWDQEKNRYQIVDWRLLKHPNQVPTRDHDGYICMWSDFKSRDITRVTRCKLFRETYTQYDPELVEREFLAEGKRKKLRPIPEPPKKPE